MKIFIYYVILFFSLGAIIGEIVNNFKSFKLIKYSFKPNEYFFKDKLFYTERLPGDNSSGSQGEFIYFGIIESTGKEGNIRGWINSIEKKWIYNKDKNQYYFNIWYCPKLNTILGLIEGDINNEKNSSFKGNLVQSWFRVLMFFLVLPLIIKIYNIKKENEN